MKTKQATLATDSEVSPLAPEYRAESKAPKAAFRKRLMGSADVHGELLDIAEKTAEHFVVFDLDVRHRIIERRIVGIGSLTGVECHPRETFRGAIANGAAAIILAHNHPSGDPEPSRADIELTRRFREVGELCGIPVLDHVIVGGGAGGAGGFVSLASRDWR